MMINKIASNKIIKNILITMINKIIRNKIIINMLKINNQQIMMKMNNNKLQIK